MLCCYFSLWGVRNFALSCCSCLITLITKRCSLGLSLKLYIFTWKLVNILWEGTLRLCEYLISYQTSNLFIYTCVKLIFLFCSLHYNLLLSLLILMLHLPQNWLVRICKLASMFFLLFEHFFSYLPTEMPHAYLVLSLLQLWNHLFQ